MKIDRLSIVRLVVLSLFLFVGISVAQNPLFEDDFQDQTWRDKWKRHYCGTPPDTTRIVLSVIEDNGMGGSGNYVLDCDVNNNNSTISTGRREGEVSYYIKEFLSNDLFVEFDAKATHTDSNSHYFSAARVCANGNWDEFSVLYYNSDGTNHKDGEDFKIYLGEDGLNGNWHSFNRNVNADVEAIDSNINIHYVKYIFLAGDFRLDNFFVKDSTATSNPRIEVTSPDGGEDWQIGSNHNITWTSEYVPGKVMIEYSTNSGTNWITIKDSVANNGSYGWTPDCEPSTNCLVMISNAAGGVPSDISDAEFELSSGASGVIDIPIATGNDDAEENPVGGAVGLTSSDLELVNDNGVDQVVGLRFQNVDIPQGSSITEAYIKFMVDEISSDPTYLTIHCEASDNASVFTTTAGSISSRLKTSSSVQWDVPAWNTTDIEKETPNLSSIVQEIVNRSGWSANSALVFIISGSGKRVAESYNGTSPPMLHVKFGQGSPSSGVWQQAGNNIHYNDGNVGIGISAPNHKLDVDGIIRAEEIIVESVGADFVFDVDYQLTSLTELRKFIEQHGHLPGIPSATEMEVSGTSLGEMNTLLLMKVEELTLYILQQQTAIEQLRSVIDHQE